MIERFLKIFVHEINKAADQQKISTFHNNHSERAISSNNDPLKHDERISNGYNCRNHLLCCKTNLFLHT